MSRLRLRTDLEAEPEHPPLPDHPMSIHVICPGCHTRFKVSDKFAGRTGACPKCKAAIRVPSKAEEVTVHAPKEFDRGGRGAAGELVLKPIAREDTRIVPWVMAAVVGAIVLVLAVAWLGGAWFRESMVVRAVGLLVVSPTLVVAAYTFLRAQEIEPLRGLELEIRAGLCALGYTALWGVFAYTSGYALSGDPWSWLMVAPPFVAVGGLIALGSLDLDLGSGLLHYGFYAMVTIVLRWVVGMGWIWEIGVL